MIDSGTDIDYLIVGHGIGGAAIAWHLRQLGKTFRIIHDSSAPSSSRVAAGICNPLTGKKLVKTWLADDLFPYSQSFYGNLEKELDSSFFHLTSLYRPYRSIEEQNTYLAQSADAAIAPYIGNAEDSDSISEYINMDFGALEVIRSGWVDLPLLLDKSQDFFSDKGQFLEGVFECEKLTITDDYVIWNGEKYGKLILCQGFGAVNNSLFNWLPFTPVKGEILEIETEKSVEPYIVNQGIFILPVSENKCRVGATYSWDPLDWKSTEHARNELDEKLRSLIKVPYKIAGQSAGIRPSVRDRRPLIGVHPEHSNVCIFNGLGTKGVTLAPFFANQLVQHLENNKELNPLVNIKRYFSLYFR